MLRYAWYGHLPSDYRSIMINGNAIKPVLVCYSYISHTWHMCFSHLRQLYSYILSDRLMKALFVCQQLDHDVTTKLMCISHVNSAQTFLQVFLMPRSTLATLSLSLWHTATSSHMTPAAMSITARIDYNLVQSGSHNITRLIAGVFQHEPHGVCHWIATVSLSRCEKIKRSA